MGYYIVLLTVATADQKQWHSTDSEEPKGKYDLEYDVISLMKDDYQGML